MAMAMAVCAAGKWVFHSWVCFVQKGGVFFTQPGWLGDGAIRFIFGRNNGSNAQK